MDISIGSSGAAPDVAGSGAGAAAAASLGQAQSAQLADVAALFGSLGLGTNTDVFA